MKAWSSSFSGWGTSWGGAAGNFAFSANARSAYNKLLQEDEDFKLVASEFLKEEL